MESVRSAFHAQLATVMDSLLAAAVCEIAKIFESSLCEQQVELVQKNEEISALRNKLEKVERRHKMKSAEEEQLSTVDGEGPLRQQSMTGSGNVSTHPTLVESLKEEVTGHNGALIKHEFPGSGPSLDSVAASTSEGTLAAAEQRHVDDLTATQDKIKLSQWDQDNHNADHKTLQEQASPPFLSISQSGHCSPRPDVSVGQPGEWLTGLDTSRGGVSSLFQSGSPTCSGPAISSTAKEASCFRQGFGSDETSNEGDSGPFPFLEQESEGQNSVSRHVVGHRDSRQDHPQPPSSNSQWRPRNDSVGRITITHARRAASFNSRDHLSRAQSNSQSLTLRHANAVVRPPAASGGSGRPYTCPYCTKCFTYPSHQRRHLLRHTGVRLHPCQFCDKSFLTPSELTVHTRTHTGERPFGCAQCGKRFARSGNLRAHQRDVHMGKRPFACTECGKRFAHRGNLRVHNHRVHRGERYYIDDQQEADMGPNPI